ncbi:MAG TPA: hypothetical protein VIV61_03200 [Candidatus Ozemobacteraceae bacterium]
MKKRIGIWVDRRRAVIVTVGQGEEQVQVVASPLEGTGAPKGRSQHGQHDIVPDAAQLNQESLYLKKYYNDIVELVKGADYLMLMGPGEARVELRNALEQRSLGYKILEVKPADKMTDREAMLAVRDYYAGHQLP